MSDQDAERAKAQGEALRQVKASGHTSAVPASGINSYLAAAYYREAHDPDRADAASAEPEPHGAEPTEPTEAGPADQTAE